MEWETPILREIGTKRFNDIFKNIRSTAIKPTFYKTLTACVKRGMVEITAERPQFRNMRTPTFRIFKTREIAGRDNIIEYIRAIDLSEIRTPTKLSICAISGIAELPGQLPMPGGIGHVWLVAKCPTEESKPELTPTPTRNNKEAYRLLPDLRSANIEVPHNAAAGRPPDQIEPTWEQQPTYTSR